MDEIAAEVAALRSLYGDDAVRSAGGGEDEDSNGVVVVHIDISPRVAAAAGSNTVTDCECDDEPAQPVEVWLGDSAGGDLPKGRADVLFSRTISGRRWHAAFGVASLPPVHLCCIAGRDEDEEEAVLMTFTIASDWLARGEMEAVARRIDAIAVENAGMHVMSAWAAFVENDMLHELGIDCSAPYTIVDGDDTDALAKDDRVTTSCGSALDRLVAILQHDVRAEGERWRTSMHECCVCYAELLGSEMHRPDGCEHVVCNECIADYVNARLAEGQFLAIECPQQNCASVISAPAIKAAMSDDNFAKWEALCSHKFIDIADDMDWCPRCNLIAVKTPTPAADYAEPPSASTSADDGVAKSPLAQCAYCGYAYCAECRGAYHPTTYCQTLEDLLEELTDDSKPAESKTKKDKKQPDRAGPAAAAASDAKTQSAAKRKQHVLSQILLRKISKKCPQCGVAIEKISGCDMVTCTRCDSRMCWVCGKKIASYDHFDKCGGDDIFNRVANVFGDAPQAVVAQRELLERAPQLAARLRPCPRCRQRALKAATDNNVRCPTCRTSFCYQCGAVLRRPITAHFGAGAACRQHTDD